ncbi:hypothetical protein, partial [Streptococcus mitis]|uniref:hypothetical protein n=1 Tax=Streptococcus mitis TaxID=28037 RepID=UPI0021B61D0C
MQFKDGTARGWIFVSDGTTHTPNGTDSYVIRVIRTGGTGTMSFFAASGTNWARQVRRTATAAPGTNDKLIIAGIFTGVGLNTRHTV